MREAPLFIVGAPRSGTTLLYKALCLHPEAAWISNWVRRFPARPELAVLNRVARRGTGPRARAWFSGDNAYVFGHDRPTRHRAFPTPTEGGTLITRHLGPAPVPAQRTARGEASGPAVARDALARFTDAADTVVRWSGGRVLVNKCIVNNRRLPELVAADPRSRFVHLVRDGRAVSASLAKVDWWPGADLWWWQTTPARWTDEGNDPWEACARCWTEETDLVDRTLRRHIDDGTLRADQVITLRYEDLVADMGDRLAALARFAGLSASATWSNAVSAVATSPTADRWRRELDADALATVERVAGPMLRRWGYR